MISTIQRRRWLSLLLLAAAAADLVIYLSKPSGKDTSQTPDRGYASARTCQPCHAKIFQTYQSVGMARSFYLPGPENVIEDYSRNNHFYHRASDRHYVMAQRNGRFYQRRYQLDSRRREVHVFEQEVSYIIGSGNHARSYLHRSENGELTELPVSWYSQEGGWGMSPGFDKAKHFDFARQIDHGCMFCHNAYPDLSGGSDDYGMITRFPSNLPAGIDCQRCHGPGLRHAEMASSGKSPAGEIRAAIVNPARLSAERQMDVCMQCHLETTSAALPHGTRRFGRAAYSYRPGEPLGDYMVHFDHPRGAGYDDKFEIVNQAYRLRQSACFLKSSGRLTCTTCHNPHEIPRGAAAAAHYRERCLSCHPHPPAASHPDTAASHCAQCHMPPRRTDDAVHVIMTDHLIQRRPARNLAAPRQERDVTYRGPLVLYYPPDLPGAERDRYLGIGLVAEGADRNQGIKTLQSIVSSRAKVPAKLLVELADAYAAEENWSAAIDMYRKALDSDPRLEKAHYNYAQALEKTGDLQEALQEYGEVLRKRPDFPEASYSAANLLVKAGKSEEAIRHYQNALRSRPAYAEAHSNLGNLYLEQGRLSDAVEELQQALNVEPAFPEAYNNLAKAYAGQGEIDLAVESVRRALAIDPDYAQARLNLGRLLHRKGSRDAAIAEYRRVLQTKPDLAAAHLSLGIALGEKLQLDAAIEQFLTVLKLQPGHAEARSNLQLALEMKANGAR